MVRNIRVQLTSLNMKISVLGHSGSKFSRRNFGFFSRRSFGHRINCRLICHLLHYYYFTLQNLHEQLLGRVRGYLHRLRRSFGISDIHCECRRIEPNFSDVDVKYTGDTYLLKWSFIKTFIYLLMVKNTNLYR